MLLINCLAYIDLNPVRTGIVKKSEQYRWCSLGHHVQRNNVDDFLSVDFRLRGFGIEDRVSPLAGGCGKRLTVEGHILYSPMKV